MDIRAHLARRETQVELARCDASERFPSEVIAQVTGLGLPLLYAAAPGAPYTTSYHVNNLAATAAQQSGSLAISLCITPLALLPVYIAGTREQLALVRERVMGGAQAALLLSEWAHGSHLLACETRAQPGRIEVGGRFVPSGTGEEAHHYLITGEKQLINLGRRAALLMTLARTSDRPTVGLAAAGGLSLFLVERDSSVDALPRWRTLPAPAADIGGTRFRGTRVPAANRIGEEGEGFRLVRETLTVSRGGISALASGTASRACGLAFAHARERVLYGQPIGRLSLVADHLARMAALDLAASCLSVAATAAVNALGQRAAHLTAIAKLVACDLAEQAVMEGRAVLSARALLADLPYQQVVRDVTLYGIFDGTRHLMLDQIQWRVRQMSRPGSGDDDPGKRQERQAIYREPAACLVDSTRVRGLPWLPRPADSAAELAGLSGAVDLGAVLDGARALEAATAALPDEAWADAPLTAALASSWARLEAALAVAELGDPERRVALGLSSLAAPGSGADRLPLDPATLARLAVALVAGDALSDARAALAACGIDLGADAAERALALEGARAARLVREAIREWN